MSYRDDWPIRFAEIGISLRRTLGDAACRIDHIGSTAVSGLAAKDIIDVQVSVRTLAPEIDDALNLSGYRRLKHITGDHIPPGASDNPAEWEKWFFKPLAIDSPVNVHVRIQGRENQRYPLVFRDYLRSNSAATAAYSSVKQGLVKHNFVDPDAYCDIKDPVCDIIIQAAELWASANEWTLGLSDA